MVRNGLRLKAELISKPSEKPIDKSGLATVWVDSGVYHLDGPYSYLVPANLNEKVFVGSFVLLPFNGRELTGLVINREDWDGRANLKSITSVVGSTPLVTGSQIELIKILMEKYLAHPFDIIRSIVPVRVASVDKNRVAPNPVDLKKRSKVKEDQYLQLPPHRPREELIAQKLKELSESGSTIAILPDVREVDLICRVLSFMDVPFTRYDAGQTRSEHYGAYLDALQNHTKLVIGTRSAVFAPVQDLRNLVIYNEGSAHLYERRSPGWSAREVALERSLLESVELTFIGYAPSLEISQLVQKKMIVFRRSNDRPVVNEYSQPFGELIPSGALTQIRKSLREGPVLFITPSKGWAHAIRCTKCKTLSKCSCGGGFEIKSEKSAISCNHCGVENIRWKCTWCETTTYSLLSRGMERHSHEIGKLLPGVLVKSSSSDSPIEAIVSEGIVVSTPGMSPQSAHGYSAVVFLEGNRLLNQPDMRAQERARELYFSHSALVRKGGRILLIQDEGMSISTTLRMWNPIPALESELNERFELGLPPFTHTVELTMAQEEVVRFKNALLKAREEGRLPLEMKILGPIVKGENSSIVLTTEITRSREVNLLIHEFMRRRSATKKVLPSLRINPYSLSR